MPGIIPGEALRVSKPRARAVRSRSVESEQPLSQHPTGPDPIVNSDRITGTTGPETGEESNAVAGRPAVKEKDANAFHVTTETKSTEKKPLNESQALDEGGSFDGVAPLQDIDAS